ncbi:MAG: outer membrane beta-barrel protein [Immundisolibacterales bacterium]|nr:outer membrane beta-barrel protein [Immundisolibacterales bacterium]
MSPFHSSSLRSLLHAVTAATVSFMLSATAAAADTGTAAADSRDYYLRAGVTLERSRDVRFLDRDCSSETPAALYGCGDGPDGTPLQSRGGFDTMPGFELGLGFRASPLLRLEAGLAYRPTFSFQGEANFLERGRRQEVSVDASSISAMLAAYLDLPGLGMPRLGPFSPFVGGGIGVSRIETDETHMEFPRTRTIVPGGHRTDFAWMLVAGLAVSAGERTTLELAWRYADFGTVETGRGTGRVVWRDASREPLPLDLAETRASLASHGLHLSLRYAF